MTSLLQELKSLETDLHHPGVRCSREQLEKWLHPDFHEVGRSGRQYERQTIIDYLSSDPVQPEVVSDEFEIVILAPEIALLTYRSAQVEPGKGFIMHTLRSSVWVKTGDNWQIRYHQGTPAAETWC